MESCCQHLDIVEPKRPVACEDRQILQLRLRNEESVERITVMCRERHHPQRVPVLAQYREAGRRPAG
jgi:hypothetical protein